MAIAHVLSLLTTFAILARGREITFPPVSGFSQQPIFEQGGIDISAGSAFAGLTTYANLHYVHCLAGKGEEVEKYDIAILGAPFDTVSRISCYLHDWWWMPKARCFSVVFEEPRASVLTVLILGTIVGIANKTKEALEIQVAGSLSGLIDQKTDVDLETPEIERSLLSYLLV